MPNGVGPLFLSTAVFSCQHLSFVNNASLRPKDFFFAFKPFIP
jgi:hypothetical protein